MLKGFFDSLPKDLYESATLDGASELRIFAIIFAALVLAAVPTLLVFVFCQHIIMRGIVVPAEK